MGRPPIKPERPIELRLNSLAQLFHTLDPYPFHERDLDRDAEEFIFEWARELPRDQPLEIVIHLPESERTKPAAAHVENAIHGYFRYRAEVVSHDLGELLAVGRISLLVGVTVLILCLIISSELVKQFGNAGPSRWISEGLLIFGWVATWRPAQTFLYDWWPLVWRRRLCGRLANATIRLIAM